MGNVVEAVDNNRIDELWPGRAVLERLTTGIDGL